MSNSFAVESVIDFSRGHRVGSVERSARCAGVVRTPSERYFIRGHRKR
jgi:hypothetical protein